ncbi:MAG: gliding motility-associated C-terminal domain-containing protein [Flavobacteriales bacterium]|nr:gliding motility-associated C-terminal domain-containing protein [Flavobacteriales bacterium]
MSATAVTVAPNLYRACLDVADSTVTITFSGFDDACSSFKKHHVFGSELGVSYTIMATINQKNITSISFKLPNTNPTWSFYFETLFLCNGVDSISSNTIKVDTEKPEIVQLDSVSIDFNTQKIIVGWGKNPSDDTKGYRIYKNIGGNSGGINSLIGDTSSTFYTVKNLSVTNKNQITMASFDSCNLFSPIDSFHSPMVLSTMLDTCSKTANLIWSKYVGWNTLNQKLYYSINNSPYTPKTIDKNNSSYSFIGINSGDSVCFFIRALNGTKSSSSNISCVKIKTFQLPQTTYLSQVTITPSGVATIECMLEEAGDADSIVLFNTTTGNERLVGSQKLTPNGRNFYTWEDNLALPNARKELYFVRTYAPCIGGSSGTQTANTIYLSIQEDYLSWNPYVNWSGEISGYNIWGYNGSTWNQIATTLETSFQNSDTTIQCFYVEAVEVINIYGYYRTSTSNKVCVKRSPKFWIPNAINPKSSNNTFTVVSPNIDYSASSFFIYNRWGEIIFRTNDLRSGWNLSYSPDHKIMTGLYFYDISITDLNGHKHYFTGTLSIIN